MNRQQRRAQARQKGQGMSYADQLAKRQRAGEVSGVQIRYQHETEIEEWKRMITGKEGL